jgi:YVTN family beta-propeller protein
MYSTFNLLLHPQPLPGIAARLISVAERGTSAMSHLKQVLSSLAVVLILGCAQLASAQAISATLSVGAFPNALAVDTTRNMLYVVVNGNNTVSVINLVTQAIVAHVNVGSNPMAIAVDKNSGLVYVANDLSNTVTIINPATSFSTKTVTVGTQPEAIAVNPINGKVYVVNFQSITVSIIDPSNNNSVTAVATADTKPTFLAIDSTTGFVYVGANGNAGCIGTSCHDTLTVIDPSTNATIPVTIGVNPAALTIDPSTGKFYVANQISNTVDVVDPSNGFAVTTIANITRPTAIAVDSTGLVYVTNGTGTVTVLNPHQAFSTSTVNVSGGAEEIAFDASTNTIVVGSVNAVHANPGTVTIINAETLATTTLTVGALPAGLITNPVRGESYVANEESSSVTIITN